MIAYLLQGLSLGLSAAATPGPTQAFMIGRALSHGWRRTLPAVFSPLVTDGPIITLMVLLLTRLPEAFLRVIQVLGGAFVLFLAWRTFRAYRDFGPRETLPGGPAAGAARQSLLQAVIMNFLSPGPYIFWSLLAGPVLVRGWRESEGHGLSFLAGFYLAMLGGSTLLVVLFSAARQLGPRVNRALLGLSALALAGFGVYQLVIGWLG